MDICVLNSGSTANSIFISSGVTSILVDDGLSLKQLSLRLAGINRSPDDIEAVLVTHEHDDHCSGLPMLCKKYPKIGLYATDETAAGVDEYVNKHRCACQDFQWSVFDSGAEFQIGDLRVEPFPIQHDTGNPVGYVVSDGKYRIGIATDLGTVTEVVKCHLRNCDALVLEANHDPEMLQNSGRSYKLIHRIFGKNGHLSNYQAGDLLAEVAGPRLRAVFPAHLSGDCNTLELAERAFRSALRSTHLDKSVSICPTYRDAASQMLSF